MASFPNLRLFLNWIASAVTGGSRLLVSTSTAPLHAVVSACRRVLELVACGRQNREIAEVLFVSEFTVKRHVQNILEKLELPTRRAAANLYETAFGASRELLSA